MNIELIDNENPSRFWVSINRAVNVSGEIFFCTSCLNRWRNQLPFSNVPVAPPLPAIAVATSLLAYGVVVTDDLVLCC
jgi:hypothetical protein